MKYVTAAAALALSGFAGAAGAVGIDLAAEGLKRDETALFSYSADQVDVFLGLDFFSVESDDFQTLFSGVPSASIAKWSLTLVPSGFTGGGIAFADLGSGIEVLMESDDGDGQKYLVIATLSDDSLNFLELAGDPGDFLEPAGSLEIYGVSAVSEVPLPATLPLLAVAVAGLAFSRRRG